MELMIKKLMAEVSMLKQKLIEVAGGAPLGNLQLTAGEEENEEEEVEEAKPKPDLAKALLSGIGAGLAKKLDKKSLDLLQTEKEGLAEQLLELQTKFDHYKSVKKQQIEELNDRLEKMGELEQELEKY